MSEATLAEGGEVLADAYKIIVSALVPFVQEKLINHMETLAGRDGSTPQDWFDWVNLNRKSRKLADLTRHAGSVNWDPLNLFQTINAHFPLFKPVFEEQLKLSGGRSEELKNRLQILEHSTSLVFQLRNRSVHAPLTYTLADRDLILSLSENVVRTAGLHEAAGSIKALLSAHCTNEEGGELIRLAKPSSAIRLIRDEFRGLELDGPTSIERISPHDRIRIEIDLTTASDLLDNGRLKYGLILVVDPAEVFCLLPSPRIAPNRHVAQKIIAIPDPLATHQALRFRGTIGRHILLGLLTREPLPDVIYSDLISPQPRIFLDRIAACVDLAAANDWRLLKMEFDVG